MSFLALVGLPFLAACLGLVIGPGHPGRAAGVAIPGTAGAGLVALVQAGRVFRDGVGGGYGSDLGTVATGGPPITVAFSADAPAASVAILVCLVALLVQVYSTAYLRGDPRYSSYAALVSLFTAAMLLVVVADDLFVLLVGWEVMGICSYFLIGHSWEQPDARAGAVKAFLTTRLGDVGFLFGIFVLGGAAGTFRISAALAAVPTMAAGTVTAAALLLLAGVVGKSAQFPLHVWLPDAMAGPTPISALIHAATMVVAGVYLVARLYPVFLAAPAALAVLGVLASVSMLGAALAALAQDDIKRVLAYSTISQLAYMAGGLAVGGREAALFHVLSHGAYKALLFLAAGCLIHAVATNSMSAMGGLRRAMPVTFVTMTLGLGALAGVPPLAGFFSKEAILGAAEEAALHSPGGPAVVAPWVGWLVLVTGLITVAVTAAYAVRLWLRTFFGSPRAQPAAVADAGHGRPGGATALRAPHEAPPAMRWPLVVLAVPTALLGVTGLFSAFAPSWVTGRPVQVGDTPVLDAPAAGPEAFVPSLVTGPLAVVLLAVGALAAYLAWRRAPAADPVAALPARLRVLFGSAFGVDAVYDRVVVAPVRAAARAVRRSEADVVDAYVRGAGRGARLLGGALRRTQTGNVQTYLTGLMAGVVVLVGAVAAGAVLLP